MGRRALPIGSKFHLLIHIPKHEVFNFILCLLSEEVCELQPVPAVETWTQDQLSRRHLIQGHIAHWTIRNWQGAAHTQNTKTDCNISFNTACRLTLTCLAKTFSSLILPSRCYRNVSLLFLRYVYWGFFSQIYTHLFHQQNLWVLDLPIHLVLILRYW